MPDLPPLKSWKYRRWISEHAFDKLRSIDCTFAEFEEALTSAEVIEETRIDTEALRGIAGRGVDPAFACRCRGR